MMNMRKRFIQLFLGIFVVTLVWVLASCTRTPAIAPLKSNAVILAFGDSLTAGTGADVASSYPAVLSQLTGINIVVQGVPGETSGDGLQRLAGVLDETNPQLIILCHGGNDFLRKLPEAETSANVRSMVKMALDKNIGVVLIATPKPGFIVKPPDFYATIAKELSIPVELTALREILTDNSLKSDLIHPNAAGYKLLAERINGLLKKSGAIS